MAISQAVSDKKHYNKCKTNKLCVQCGVPATIKLHCTTCKDKHNMNSKRQYKELKDAVIQKYGNKCVCCGELNYLFLSIDHINNDGASERKAKGYGTGVTFYAWLRRNNYPDGFQVLCHICNQGKQSNGGICPHKIFDIFDGETWPHF